MLLILFLLPHQHQVIKASLVFQSLIMFKSRSSFSFVQEMPCSTWILFLFSAFFSSLPLNKDVSLPSSYYCMKRRRMTGQEHHHLKRERERERESS